MPVIEREVVVQEPVERETVVETGGGGAGMVLGILAVILIALAVFWFLGGAFGGGESASVSVDLPSVSVQK
ncbi:MAG TPA: hypothetical protein VN240_06840 [Propylenella sp.]|nr:hypothetical protein [Propylenella sp.]